MKEYALIGHPLEHSQSAEYFNSKFIMEHIDARYINIDLDNIEKVRGLLLRHPLLKGFNVTSPYKIAILKYLKEVEEEAQLIGAVNTVIVIRKKWRRRHLIGFNTDIEGFSQSIEPLLQPYQTKALVLGSGGAALAVCRAFKKLGITSQMVSRNNNPLCIRYDKITEALIKEYKIIVNATPLGMSPNVLISPPIPYRAITHEHLCYDLVYNPEETCFLTQAKQQGAQIKNGLEMLLIQANASWNLWNRYEN